MQLFKSLVLFLLFINHVFSQANLVTFDKQGQAKLILRRRDGGVTEQYRGGIWGVNIHNGQIRILHKNPEPRDSDYWNTRKYNRNPKAPDIPNQ
jgi:hypothetical protein